MACGIMSNKQIRVYIEAGEEGLLDPEDLRMFRENERAREDYFDYRGLRDLYSSICIRAVEDYNTAMDGFPVDRRDSETVLRETGSFFDSEFFRKVSGIRNGDIVRAEIKKRREENLNEQGS